MLVVAALGGNALLRRQERLEPGAQARNVQVAARSIAALAAGADVVVTHGNGPQVGLLALQNEVGGYAFPLDVVGAESEGMIGYLLEQAIGNELPDRSVATLLTQTIVRRDDPAFERPTKPIGPLYGDADAERLRDERAWTFTRVDGKWRRVVASPAPRRIVELHAIRALVDADVLVVCAGGGGIPVVVDEAGALHGVAAVIDKDRSAALLARDLAADMLLMLTDVPAVYVGWGTSDAVALASTTPRSLREHVFDEGSMGPKVEAACWFVEATGGTAAIGALEDAAAIVAGEAGTLVQPEVTHEPRP